MGFFVLSGFIISEAMVLFYSNRYRAFLTNRFARLMPPYLGAVVVSVMVHAILLKSGMLRLPDYDVLPADILSASNLIIQTTGIIPVFNFNNLLPRAEWYFFIRFAWAIFVQFVFISPPHSASSPGPSRDAS